MSQRVRILAAVAVLVVVGGIIAVSTATAVPPQPKRYYHIAPGPNCTECAPVIRTSCELTGCLPNVEGGSSLCQYDCFHD